MPPEYHIGYKNGYDHELIEMYVVGGNIFYPIQSAKDIFISLKLYEKNCSIIGNSIKNNFTNKNLVRQRLGSMIDKIIHILEAFRKKV